MKKLQDLVDIICNLTGLQTSKDKAELLGHSYCLYLENYNGYRLIGVKLDSGGHLGVFGDTASEPRLKAKEMEIKLRGIISGIEYAQKYPT